MTSSSDCDSNSFHHCLCPVLVKYPLRQPHLYALYVSRKHLPLKIRTFIDHLMEKTRIPHSWEEDPVSVEQKRSINGAPAASLVADE
jgi:hypothetical protein